MPSFHENRMARARESLEGLSLGDAFGERLIHLTDQGEAGRIIRRQLPDEERWEYTDDTQMALSIVEVLGKYGVVEQDQLAKSFVRHFEPDRGYGPTIFEILPRIRAGQRWQLVSREVKGGSGSFGNGSAMRLAPLGAYFADDLEMVTEHARRSFEVTHSHPEAIAGAITIAVAAAMAFRLREDGASCSGSAFIERVLPHVPDSMVRRKMVESLPFPPETPVIRLVRVLGNGSAISAQDTVPFALWCAAHGLDNFEETMWRTASAFGDIDTNCAIVGGIVAARVGREGLPSAWLERREALPSWPFEE